jgi:hypothetical protein
VSRKQIIGLIGTIILFAGVFAPLVSIPVIGSMNYYQAVKSEAATVLILAMISCILLLAKQYNGLWFTGLGSMAIMASTVINFQTNIDDVKSQTGDEAADSLLSGLTNIAMQSVQIQWGVALLVVGAALIITSAAIKDNSRPNR